jgi:conjugative relaxase-like TrwC/TraI family protein
MSSSIAAMFRHRTSRAGDPLLHWHTLIANVAEGPDGRWTSIVHPDIYRAVRTGHSVATLVSTYVGTIAGDDHIANDRIDVVLATRS